MNTRKNAQPKVRTIRRGRGLIARGNQLLLCNRIGTDHWYLPGGKAEWKESCFQALCRELKEETGLSSVVSDFVGVHEYNYFDARRGEEVQEVNLIFTLSFPRGLPEVVRSTECHLQFGWWGRDVFHKNFFPPALVAHLRLWLSNPHPFYGAATKTRENDRSGTIKQ